MLKDGKLFISWEDIERDSKELVKKILSKKNTYKGIVVISRGGIGVVALLSRLLDIKLIDIMCIASYSNETNQQVELEVFKEPSLAIEDKGKGWLIVDDLIDSGDTYKYVSKALPESDFVCLYNKSNTSTFLDNILYAKDYPKDTWIVLPWEISL